MDVAHVGWLVAGLVMLALGAEVLVRGASRLAALAGISPLVIGLTVVAYGTGSPELAVTLQAAWHGNADLAVANVVGSNIFNVLFILGVSALIVPLVVARQLVRLDVPIMIATSILLWALSLDGRIGRGDGGVLLGCALAYTVWAIRTGRKESAVLAAADARPPVPSGVASILLQVGYIAGGLGVLVLGARWLIAAATAIAQAIGVSDLVIGLTLVAAGTSLPEVATSIVAAIRGERDIAVGNVVGSNIFNILAVLGVASVVAGDGLRIAPSMLAFDLPVMTAVALACLPIFFTGFTVGRWEGLVLLGYYLAYALFLVLRATEHDDLGTFGLVMALFVVPLTAVTLAVLALREWHAARPR